MGVLVWAFVLPACSDPRAAKINHLSTQVIRQGLTVWEIDRTRTEAETLARNRAISFLGELDGDIETCLYNLGVMATTLSASCETTPVQSNYTTPYPVVGGSQVGAECYWKCKVEVTSEGMSYGPILILKELLTPGEVSGGC